MTRAIKALTKPVEPVYMMARVAALLSPYFEKDVPQAVRVMDAQDWAAALGSYPEWAIERAVRWWKGEDNPNRRKRPLEGDIAERCRVEMKAVRAAQIKVGRQETLEIEQQPRERVSAERMAEIIAEAGLTRERAEAAAVRPMPGADPEQAKKMRDEA